MRLVGLVSNCVIACCLFAALATNTFAENRSFDGRGNNLNDQDLGAKGTMFRRVAPSRYEDGISAPADFGRANAREISNTLCTASGQGTNGYGLSDFVWQWGQFLDHDITLAVTATDEDEAFYIDVGAGDPLEGVIPLMRTIYDQSTGTTKPREQINSVTSFIDGSNVYGSDEARAAALRIFSGGRLKVSDADLMPMNSTGLPNANDLNLPPNELFLGGDVRSNEQLGLTCMHTVFVREHNRLAELIASVNTDWDDDQIYHRARKIVGAYIQAITYNEFLPALLGDRSPNPTTFTYDPARNPAATNEFATALYRIGHTMVSDQLLLMRNDGLPAPVPSISVLDAFFSPSTLIESPETVDWILKGLSMQAQMEADTQLVDNLRNQLFGPAGSGGLDLAALNIQRGRDHGLANYNDTRAAYGLPRKNSFAEITADFDTQESLSSMFTSPDQVELWIGGLAEDHLPGLPVGELIAESMRQQFTDMAEGDRFFYRFDPEVAEILNEVEGTRLSDIILRNTGLTHLQRNVFYIPDLDLADEITISVIGNDVVLTLSGAEPKTRFALERSENGVQWQRLTESILNVDGTHTASDVEVVAAIDSAFYRFVRLP